MISPTPKTTSRPLAKSKGMMKAFAVPILPSFQNPILIRINSNPINAKKLEQKSLPLPSRLWF